jgi:hypothetical protein
MVTNSPMPVTLFGLPFMHGEIGSRWYTSDSNVFTSNTSAFTTALTPRLVEKKNVGLVSAG